ncbi:MAG: hypothetical protein ACD_21C00242G0003 [uncultured bacterium]|nr:MAG: hypothetical protein ACD_21C00242G0003 [uncultured bacterium]
MSQDLKHLRQQLRTKLQNLSPDLCAATSQKITTKIVESEIFTRSQNIACYIPIENEIDVWPIIKTIWLHGKNCYLPVFNPNTEHYLQFVKFQEHDELTISKYKIPEPEICLEKIIAPQDLDLVIVPLVGFSADNFRLGHGAGCYDRAFAFKKQNPEAKSYLLGVGHEWQHVEFAPKSWDVAMDKIQFT